VSSHGGGWQEVGDRVYRFRYRSLDLNVGAVLGDDEVLVVDTRSFAAEAVELLADLRALTPLPCRQVVNTHWHYDHCYGNATLRPAAIWGHRRCIERLRGGDAERRRELLADHPEIAGELAAVVLDPPDRPVDDAGVVFAGDLVEEGAPPSYGTDAYPLEWPATLDRLLDLAAPVVVGGHGDVVGHGFVRGQREQLAAMAALCRRVAAGELPAEAAVQAAPFPEAFARDALALSGAAGPAGGAAPGTARSG
jgi:glyoxylase-like metal-dependent hydrolase (beta-lactamase superfamily II)